MVGKEIQFFDMEIVNVAGTGGMTRSGRVFAPKYTPKVIQALVVVPTPPPQAEASVFGTTVLVETPSSFMSKDTSNSTVEATTSKDKKVVKEQEQIEKLITVEEGHKFLKLIKKSDFNIVD